MILITGASGKTGSAITRRLNGAGISVRALVHNAAQVRSMQASGAGEVIIGDLQSRDDLQRACCGIQAVYHICPNMHPQEVEIAQNLLGAAAQAGIDQFVFHSVFHPQIKTMPHHWNKMRVEELIFTSGLPYTILQPCVYMQNMLGYWPQIIEQGIYPVPYSIETRLSVVDLEDVAQAAMTVLVEQGHTGATYELCGPAPLTQVEVTEVISRELGRPIRAETVALTQWEEQARKGGLNDYARQSLIKMFEYYNQYGLSGNPTVLAWLLKRQPTSFAEFIHRESIERKNTSLQ